MKNHNKAGELYLRVPAHHRAGRPALIIWLGNRLFLGAGWRLQGAVPVDKKLVLVLGPHTSNWDFVVAMTAMLALDIELHWLGKHTLFKKPLGSLMRWLGGLPVNRTNPQGFAEEAARQIRTADKLILAITPEGTRKPVARLKTGFSRIARATPCPILPVTMDFARREICLLPLLNASDDSESDAEQVKELFSAAKPKHPQQFSSLSASVFDSPEQKS